MKPRVPFGAYALCETRHLVPYHLPTYKTWISTKTQKTKIEAKHGMCGQNDSTYRKTGHRRVCSESSSHVALDAHTRGAGAASLCHARACVFGTEWLCGSRAVLHVPRRAGDDEGFACSIAITDGRMRRGGATCQNRRDNRRRRLLSQLPGSGPPISLRCQSHSPRRSDEAPQDRERPPCKSQTPRP